MRRLRVIGLPATLAVCAGLLTAGPAAAKSFECRTALGPVLITGNLVVPAGALCELNGTHVTGNATVKSGPPEPSEPTALTANGATIDGNVKVQQNAQFLASAGATKSLPAVRGFQLPSRRSCRMALCRYSSITIR